MSLNKSVLKTSSYRDLNLCLECSMAEASLNGMAGIDRIGRYGDIFSVASLRSVGTVNKRVAVNPSNVP